MRLDHYASRSREFKLLSFSKRLLCICPVGRSQASPLAASVMAERHPTDTDSLQRSSPAMMARISAMMFLQYWPLGVWGVTVGTYIAANTGREGNGIFSAGFVGYSTAAGAIGSLLSPVLIGFLSDRYFAAQNLLALLHVGCALAAWGMYESHAQAAFFVWLLIYYQCFSPAAALTNKISLKHLANADAEYPLVRIFSTIGWITAGLFVGFAWPQATGQSIEPTRIPLIIGTAGSIVMALFSVTLPDTPPEEHSGLFLSRILRDSGELLRNQPLVVLLLVSMLVCIPTMAYNNFANPFLNNLHYGHPAALMTLGQVSDLFVLGMTPWLIKRFSLRSLFASGAIAWGARYGLLAAGSFYDTTWPAYVAILVNGPCFVFIYVIGVMYVDRLVCGAHRGAAQGMFALATGGLGNLVGAFTVGYTQSICLTPEGVSPAPYNWPAFWSVPAILSVISALIFIVSFKAKHSN
jgi:nucleoside transporter